MHPERRSLIILGATGSIGCSTLDLVRRYPERFAVAALSANRRGRELVALASEFPEAALYLADETARDQAVADQPGLRARFCDRIEDLFDA